MLFSFDKETNFYDFVLFGTDAFFSFGGSDKDDDEDNIQDDVSYYFYRDDQSTGSSVYEDADMGQSANRQHVLINAFEGVKQVWVSVKHFGLVGTVMEVVEGVASTVAKTTLGADLDELEKRLVRPRLQAADDLQCIE